MSLEYRGGRQQEPGSSERAGGNWSKRKQRRETEAAGGAWEGSSRVVLGMENFYRTAVITG